VEIENNLEVLRLRNYLPCSSMPFWAPDFARPASLCYPSLALTDGINHLSACGGRSLRYQLSSNLEVLTFQGVPVDMIERGMELREFDEEPSIVSTRFTRWPPLLLIRTRNYYLARVLSNRCNLENSRWKQTCRERLSLSRRLLRKVRASCTSREPNWSIIKKRRCVGGSHHSSILSCDGSSSSVYQERPASTILHNFQGLVRSRNP
jgi:hypothetical protein